MVSDAEVAGIYVTTKQFPTLSNSHHVSLVVSSTIGDTPTETLFMYELSTHLSLTLTICLQLQALCHTQYLFSFFLDGFGDGGPCR